MNLIIDNLAKNIRVSALMARFDQPFDKAMKQDLLDDGFGDAECQAIGCLGWIWRQCLALAPVDQIRGRVKSIVERGMKAQKLSTRFDHRPVHDLFLLHCAILASNNRQLIKLAERVVDASGNGTHAPEFEDLYASAWCGMLKYTILGKDRQALKQSEMIWKAYHTPWCRGAAKPLVAAWLARNWDDFLKKQKEDFGRLWKRARRDRIVKSEKGNKTVVSTESLSIPQLWCWGHAGLAVMAFRRFGVQVATDPFWFPSHALEVVPKS